MKEEELNELVKEHYGFTIDEIDEDIGKLSLRVNQLEYNNKKLQEENKSLQSQLKAKEEVATKLKEWLEEMLNELKQNDVYDRTSYEMGQIITTECIITKIEELEKIQELEILSKGENK